MVRGVDVAFRSWVGQKIFKDSIDISMSLNPSTPRGRIVRSYASVRSQQYPENARLEVYLAKYIID